MWNSDEIDLMDEMDTLERTPVHVVHFVHYVYPVHLFFPSKRSARRDGTPQRSRGRGASSPTNKPNF